MRDCLMSDRVADALIGRMSFCFESLGRYDERVLLSVFLVCVAVARVCDMI